MSLMPRSRLIIDSHRSPSGAAIADDDAELDGVGRGSSPAPGVQAEDVPQHDDRGEDRDEHPAGETFDGLVRADPASRGVRPRCDPTNNPPMS